MEQLRIHAPGELRLDAVEPEAPGPDDVVLRVKACGICGSDLGYIDLGGVAGPGPEPMPLGHEFSAVVAWVGARVASVAVGARVVVNPIAAGNAIGNGGSAGGFGPEVVARRVDSAGVLFPIPDTLSFEHAALAEPLGVGMQAVNRAALQTGDKVTIFGAGPIGLLALATLRYRGFDDVAVVDLARARLDIARELGATHTLDGGGDDLWSALRERHGTALFLETVPTVGSDAYIEASGAPTVLGEIVAHARPGARVSLVALHRQPETLNLVALMAKQLTLAGSMAYPDDYGEMVRMLGDVDLSALITHRFALADYRAAFETARDPSRAGKVLIEP